MNDEPKEASRQNRDLMRAIIASSGDAVISQTLAGIITSWNGGAEKLFGYSAKAAVGQSARMLFPPELGEEEGEILKRIAQGESIDHYETVLVRKDGSRVDVSVTVSPVRDSSGKIAGASKIARDITARNEEATRLKTQLARLDLLNRITRAIGERQDLKRIYQTVIRSLEDQLPVDFACICTYDAASNAFEVSSVGVKSEGVWVELNRAEKFRIPIDESGLSQCLAGELIYEPDLGAITSGFSDRLAKAGLGSVVISPLFVESEVFGMLAVGRREPNSFSSVECEFLSHLSAHTAIAAHQAQLYSALQCAYEDLRQSQHSAMQQERLRALGEMATGVAHDINNGLSPILLYTSLLLDSEKNLSDVARDYLKIIQRAGSDISATIARLHEFYRQREPQLVLEPVQLNILTPQVISLTRPRWHDEALQRGVEVDVRTELSPGLPLILGVESEIREALVNLILNSADAMPKGGTILLRTSASATTTTIQVADTGTGMDIETRQRCLEPFFTTKGERGTGLGLGMVYGIIKRHNGNIDIDSQPGKGTTISLTFPIAVRLTVDAVKLNGPAKSIPRLRLLVVDDDPLILKALYDTLEGDGHIVVTANGGRAGIDEFKKAFTQYQPFAAVITDLGMPCLDGRTVAGAIKAISPITPVILLTGWGRRMKADGDVPKHVDSVLSKPPKPGELREALARHVSAA